MRADGNGKKSLNSAVAHIFESLFHDSDMANMSLSGNKCPSQSDSIAKPKFPQKVADAIESTCLLLIHLF